MTAKITSISVSGIRTLDSFTLDLNDLTVLIGENGSGKSSVVEAFELLRRLTSQNFVQEFNGIHGGEPALLRVGAGQISLVARIEGDSWTASYEVVIGKSGITEERLSASTEGTTTLLLSGTGNKIDIHVRKGINAKVGHSTQLNRSTTLQQAAIALNGWSHPDPIVQEVSVALRAIDVQLPFNTMSNWAARSQGRPLSPLRDSVTIAPVDRLERFGVNLPNAYYVLRNDSSADEWSYTMELVRLGLGSWVESVNARADVGGGKIALWIKPNCIDSQIPAASLSDGQLAYLAFVALARLPTDRSVLVFDEVELHLHPRLLTQVLSLLQSIAQKTPVVLTTHSRQLLDNLNDPAKSVGVLELDPQTLRTTLQRFDKQALGEWLEDYGGLGQLLDAGYQESLFTAPTSHVEVR